MLIDARHSIKSIFLVKKPEATSTGTSRCGAITGLAPHAIIKVILNPIFSLEPVLQRLPALFTSAVFERRLGVVEIHHIRYTIVS